MGHYFLSPKAVSPHTPERNENTRLWAIPVGVMVLLDLKSSTIFKSMALLAFVACGTYAIMIYYPWSAESVRSYYKAIARNFASSFSYSDGPVLPHIKHFDFHINNPSLCEIKSDLFPLVGKSMSLTHNDSWQEQEKGIYLIILVFTAPKNLVERQAIRETYGSVKRLENWGIRLIFLLGSVLSLPSEVRESVINESMRYGDVVSSYDFQDTYRNLTLKHLMGYQWVLDYCRGAKFVLKTDDDVFIDLFQVFKSLSGRYGFNSSDVLTCAPLVNVKPIRRSSGTRSKAKWIVTRDEYPHDKYPDYCLSWGIFLTPDVAERILNASTGSKLFWIDDIYVTGVLRDLIGQKLVSIDLKNSMYTNCGSGAEKDPCAVICLERGPEFSEEMKKLWNRAINKLVSI